MCLGAPFLLQLGVPKHRSVWLSYLNFSIYATFVGLALSYNHCPCRVSILFADVLVNTAIPTSNIIFVNVFYLLVFLLFLLILLVLN